jgi:heme-transporting ATPase
MTLLAAHDLAAAYDGRMVFSGLDLALGPGAHALTGHNGSGKSTLLRLLAGAQAPAAGRVTIAGLDLARDGLAARRQLSYAPDDNPAYPFMRGRELLTMVAAAKGVALGPVVDRLLAAFALSAQLDQRVDGLSLGTQKKLLLAAAWIGAPRVILLDEPSNGLDLAARDALVERIRLDAAQAAILLATHDEAFIEATGARVVTLPERAAA